MFAILMAELNARWAASYGLVVASNGPCTCASASIRALGQDCAACRRVDDHIHAVQLLRS